MLFLVGLVKSKELLYSAEVLTLYLNPKDTKAIGRLLPTNAFSVLETQENRVLLRLEGYSNPNAPSVLYANNHQRVLVAAFAKHTPLKLHHLEPVQKDRWGRVRLEVWTDKSSFSPNLQTLFSQASKLFSNNCGTCHALHKPQEFRANAWPAIFRSMQSRTSIAKKDRWLVIEYLQKHAKDFKNP
nr:cytochrome C [Helicobacter heilmannii]